MNPRQVHTSMCWGFVESYHYHEHAHGSELQSHPNTTHKQHFEQTKSQQFQTPTGQTEEDCKRTTNKLPGSLFNRHSTVENFRGTSHGIDPPILCFDRLLRREETTVSWAPLSSAQNDGQRTQKHVRARSQSLNTVVVEDPQKPQQSTGDFRAHFPCAYAHRLLESRFATPTQDPTQLMFV